MKVGVFDWLVGSSKLKYSFPGERGNDKTRENNKILYKCKETHTMYKTQEAHEIYNIHKSPSSISFVSSKYHLGKKGLGGTEGKLFWDLQGYSFLSTKPFSQWYSYK